MIPRPPQRISSPTAATLQLRERIVQILARSWPDAISASSLIERLGAPPSSVRRLLVDLRAVETIVKTDEGWRYRSRPSTPASAGLRPGRPTRPLGFFSAYLAQKEPVHHG